MKEQDKIKELFSEKLGNFEAPVNSALWKGVASQIGVSSATVTTGVSLMTKILVGIAATAVVGLTTYFVVMSNSQDTPKVTAKKLTNVNSEDEHQVAESEESGKVSVNDEIQPTTTNLVNDNHRVSINPSDNTEEIKDVLVESTIEPINKPNETKPNVSERMVVKPNKTKPIINEPIEGKKPQNDVNQIIESNNVSESTANKASFDNVPNVFTPNGDGVNDVYFIEFSGDLYDFSVVIMDNKNQTIYSSSDPKFEWDGSMMNGELASKGRYLCFVSAKDSKGNRVSKSQMLSIE